MKVKITRNPKTLSPSSCAGRCQQQTKCQNHTWWNWSRWKRWTTEVQFCLWELQSGTGRQPAVQQTLLVGSRVIPVAEQCGTPDRCLPEMRHGHAPPCFSCLLFSGGAAALSQRSTGIPRARDHNQKYRVPLALCSLVRKTCTALFCISLYRRHYSILQKICWNVIQSSIFLHWRYNWLKISYFSELDVKNNCNCECREH